MIRRLKKLFFKLIEHSPLIIRHSFNFRLVKGHWPRLFCPKDYSDYITRDNIFGRHNKHAYLADKLEVRKYVKERGLEDILVPLLGSWDDASKIDFDSLPNQFAIKCNHSCGMNIICFDKSKLDIEATRKQLDQWLHEKHSVYFEQHYEYIKPMIIAEALIPSDEDGHFPTDYKIHCAGGKPIFIQVCIDRTEESVGHRVMYSPEWQKLPYIIHDYHYTDADIPRPNQLDEMLDIASKLSQGLDYARVDLYEVGGKSVLFGEITLTPMGGWLSFFTQEALDVMGQAIKKGIYERKHK
jgi:hypothetical protein